MLYLVEVVMNRPTRILLYGMFLVIAGLLFRVVWPDDELFEFTARLCVVAGALIGMYGAFTRDEA